MKFRNLPWVQLLITVAIAVLLWATYTFAMEWVDYEYESPPSRAVLDNPLLATTRLVDQFGYDTDEINNTLFFSNLKAVKDDVVWLYDSSAITEKKLLDELMQWTSNGGHLILGITSPMPDDLEEILLENNVEVYSSWWNFVSSSPWEEIYQQEFNIQQDENDYVFDELDRPRSPHAPINSPYNEAESTRLTQKAKSYQPEGMTIEYKRSAEIFTRDAPIHGLHWHNAKNPSDPYINIQISHGAGVLTLLGDSTMFSNKDLKRSDNASYLLQLLNTHPGKKIHYFLELSKTPGLLGTLWNRFPVTLLVFAAALLAWILNAAARLGTVRAEQVPGRTNLISHLRARGHFWRRRGNFSPMTELVREAAIKEIKRRNPTAKFSADGSPPVKIQTELAQSIGCSVSQVQRALAAAPTSARDLPDAALVHQHILHHLSSSKIDATRRSA